MKKMAGLVAIGSKMRIRSSANCQTAINIEAHTKALAAIAAIWEIFIFVCIRAIAVWSTGETLATNQLRRSYIDRCIKSLGIIFKRRESGGGVRLGIGGLRNATSKATII